MMLIFEIPFVYSHRRDRLMSGDDDNLQFKFSVAKSNFGCSRCFCFRRLISLLRVIIKIKEIM